MKLDFLSFDYDKFASEMQNLKEKKHFDYLVTIVGEDFGPEEGLDVSISLRIQRPMSVALLR